MNFILLFKIGSFLKNSHFVDEETEAERDDITTDQAEVTDVRMRWEVEACVARPDFQFSALLSA